MAHVEQLSQDRVDRDGVLTGEESAGRGTLGARVERDAPLADAESAARVTLRAGAERDGALADAESAARSTLRAQVERLERELSQHTTRSFPHIAPAPVAEPAAAPRLLGLAELERLRDELAARVADTQRRVAERSALERRSRELLRRAQADPRRYKFLRIAVADLGEGLCGAWEVRPRFGPIGMVAGWWQLKLSSGCP